MDHEIEEWSSIVQRVNGVNQHLSQYHCIHGSGYVYTVVLEIIAGIKHCDPCKF